MVDYRFSRESLEDIEEFGQEVQKKIFEKIEQASDDHFYNSEHYSKFYDHHGRVWDKLSFEINGEPIRAVFVEREKFFIIFIGNHEDFDYDTELYNLLQSRE
jgi:hypothetical protein